MPTHTLISGEPIAYEAAPELAAFIARAALAVADSAVSVSDLVELLYGEDNPLLQRGVIPGRGFVTPAVLANPAYRVFLDLLDRKRVATGSLDLAASDAAHTLTVTEAARRLGISTGAVRQAIARGTLAAVPRGGQYWLREEAVASYQVSTRGPARARSPSLVAWIGTSGDNVMQIRSDAEFKATRQEGHIIEGAVDGWTWATVKTARRDLGSLRVFELRPGRVENRVEFGELQVVGRFEIVRTLNNAREAEAAWKAAAERKAALAFLLQVQPSNVVSCDQIPGGIRVQFQNTDHLDVTPGRVAGTVEGQWASRNPPPPPFDISRGAVAFDEWLRDAYSVTQPKA